MPFVPLAWRKSRFRPGRNPASSTQSPPKARYLLDAGSPRHAAHRSARVSGGIGYPHLNGPGDVSPGAVSFAAFPLAIRELRCERYQRPHDTRVGHEDRRCMDIHEGIRARQPKLSPLEPSETELLPDQAGYLAAVGAALGLLHHGADDRADRLAVAAADLLGGLGVGLDRGGDDRVELAAVGDLGEALAVDDRLRVAALGDQGRQHLLAAAVRDLLLADQADQRGQRRAGRP